MSVLTPTPPPCTGGTLYTVTSGDTLQSIAEAFGITLQALVAANPQLITPGQELCVPVLAATCCLLLAPTPVAPATAAGVAYVKQQAPDMVTLLVGALNLPSPSVFGSYNAYFARVVQPSGASSTFALARANPGASPSVYAGATSGPLGPLATASDVLVFAGTAAGAVGPVVLQGSLANCH